MELENIFFVTMILILVLIIGLAIYESTKPYEKVEKEYAYKYSGSRIETNIRTIKEVKDSTELEFIIFIPISNGKTTALIPIPIFDNYRVFTTDSSIYLAFDKKVPDTNRDIVVKGYVDNDKSGNKFVIKVSTWNYVNGRNDG